MARYSVKMITRSSRPLAVRVGCGSSSQSTSALTLASGRLAAALGRFLRSCWRRSTARSAVECHPTRWRPRPCRPGLPRLPRRRPTVPPRLWRRNRFSGAGRSSSALVFVVDEPEHAVVVLLQGDGERLRAREEPLLERLEHEAGGDAVGGRARRVVRASAYCWSSAWSSTLVRRSSRPRAAGCSARGTGSIRPSSSSAPTSSAGPSPVQLFGLGHHAAGEPLVVEQLQQRGEALLVAVVRGGGEEQLVLEVRRRSRGSPWCGRSP